MTLEPEDLRRFLTGRAEPLDTLTWLADTFLPYITEQLNSCDVRRRLGIYAGERIPENERNLTDVRNRVSLILEYEIARTATRLLESKEVSDLFWSYVVANRFPDLEVRNNAGERGLRIEVKCLQTLAEEKSANFDTLKKDLHPTSDFVVVFLWEWRYDADAIRWDRAPTVLRAFVFHAASLAVLRDWYWLNQPPTELGNGRQGFDLRFAVNCRNGKYNEEEGNYGKLLRIWQRDFRYQPPMTPVIGRTIEDYLEFKNLAISSGFDTLAHRFLPTLSGDPSVVAVNYDGAVIGWRAGEVAFIPASLIRAAEDRKNIITTIPATRIFALNDKYAWVEYRSEAGTLTQVSKGNKPKKIPPGQS